MVDNDRNQRYDSEVARTAAGAVGVTPSVVFGGTVLGAMDGVDRTRDYWEKNPEAAAALADELGTTVEAMLSDLDASSSQLRDSAVSAGDDAVAIIHPDSPGVDRARSIDFPV